MSVPGPWTELGQSKPAFPSGFLPAQSSSQETRHTQSSQFSNSGSPRLAGFYHHPISLRNQWRWDQEWRSEYYHESNLDLCSTSELSFLLMPLCYLAKWFSGPFHPQFYFPTQQGNGCALTWLRAWTGPFSWVTSSKPSGLGFWVQTQTSTTPVIDLPLV